VLSERQKTECYYRPTLIATKNINFTLMPSLDKSSVRNEVSRLKTDFATLYAEGKIAGEVGAAVE